MDAWLTLLGSLLAAIIGGLVVDLATRRRELEKDRRAERIKYLVVAFRAIMQDLDKTDPDANGRFETAIEDITLFGSDEQVRQARKIRHFRSKGGPVEYGPLLESLRNDLRRELGLKRVPLFAHDDAEY